MTAKRQTPHLRLWPGILSVVLAWVITFGSGLVAPGTFVQFFGMMGGPALALLILLGWWAFASRAPKAERWLGVGLTSMALVLAFVLAAPSMRMAVMIYGIPTLVTTFVATVFLLRAADPGRRRRLLALVIVMTCGFWTLLRSEGVDGDMATDFAWRWQPTAEQRLLASLGGEELAVAPPIAPAAWPGFRGPERDGVLRGVTLATDWASAPPELLWRRPVGPGWSSFALAGGLLYTQEQLGDEEAVSAYRADTGEPVWRRLDTARFWEALAGAGPRATPTVVGTRVYSLGATGLLNALDATSGELSWQRDVAADTGAPVPQWGFSSSPLVRDGLVVVHTGAPEGKGVVAYDAATGEPRWLAPAGPLSYSSVHVARLGGTEQWILLTGDGAAAYAPADGEVLWRHDWQVPGGARVVQPGLIAERTVLVGTGFGMGMRRLEVMPTADGWEVEERWTSTRLKPYYNDFVVHRDHVYGFDNRILACIELESGERAWKGGRYGNGQLLLLADQDLLLVLSDRGEVALVEASPEGFREIARFEAIEGKTWNHPVLADGVLYVRNGEEMAAYRMTPSN